MFRRYVTTGDLAETIPIFPLSGALLLPRGVLPLNIFEPRYIKMIDDAMHGSRLIGMIQPRVHERESQTPPVYDVGCVGRITSYGETDDARYLIKLSGLCRFRVGEELATTTPYRQVRAAYEEFAGDLAPTDDVLGDQALARLHRAIKAYLSRERMRADWEHIKSAPPEQLVNALAMICPFPAPEKQALLEARDLATRAETLVSLISMSGPDTPTAPPGTALQ